MNFSNNRVKKVWGIVFLMFILCFIPFSSYSDAPKRVRVGLAAPDIIYTSCDLSFEGGHVLRCSSAYPPCYTFGEGADYVIKRMSGTCELSSETKASIGEFDLSLYPSAVPFVTSEGLRLMNSNMGFSATHGEWESSVLEDVVCASAYVGDEIKFSLADSFAMAEPSDSKPFKFYVYPYRGGVSFYTGEPNGVFPINDIELEQYLRGVVAQEMPHEWSKEALKAQAICARTYAMGSLGRFSDMDYDLAPTVVSQAYGGVGAERDSTDLAISETAGAELFYGEDRVQCFYHASNGGYCSASEDVFSSPLPYFSPKPDPYTMSVVEPWVRTFTSSELSEYLASEDVYIGEVRYLKLDKNPSRRVEKVEIVGSQGSHIVSGRDFRYEYGLNSANFKLIDSEAPTPSEFTVLSANGLSSVNKVDMQAISSGGDVSYAGDKRIITASGIMPLSQEVDQGLTIEGYGYGHGLGMSQWGAKVMAERGFDYQEILGFYYEGALVTFP